MTADRARAVGLALVLVALFAVSAAAPAVAQTGQSGQVVGSPDLSVLATSQEFEPGTRAELDLTLSNRGEIFRGGPSQYEERVTTARGVVVAVRSGAAPVEIDGGSVGVGNVETGTASVPPIGITVAEDAAPGTYRLPVEVSYAFTRTVDYDVYGASYNDFEETETRHVTVRIRDQPRFAVVNRSSSAQIGDRGALSVTVENVGSRRARMASVTATSRSDELRLGTGSESSTANVGRWAPGERHTLEYTVETSADATRREYTVDLGVDYRDTDGIDRTSRTLTVGVTPAAEQSFALAGVTTSLRVGEEGTVTGSVINEGPGPVTDPVVVLSTGDSDVVVDAREYAIPDLAPGERARFEYDVTVSEAASASVRQFNLTTRYRTARGDLRRSDGLETVAEIAPRRDRFAVEIVEDGLAAGEATALTVRLTNEGDEPLRTVEAKAFVRSPLSSDDDEAIVPDLAPGETATFTVALSAAGDALPKRYPVSFDFQYERPDGDREVSRTYTAAVTVTEPTGGGPPLIPGVAAVAVLVVGLLAWRRRSRSG